MKKYLLNFTIISALFLVLSSCSFSVKGEGKVTTKEIKLNNISQLKAEGNYRVIYLYDNKNPRMVIETYKNLIENLKINNAGGQLSLSESRKVKDTDLYNIYIYNPEIERFDLHNSVNVDINSQLRVSKLNLTLSETSKFLGNNIITDELVVKASNTSKISLQGTANKIILTGKDQSDFSAPYLEISDAQILLYNVATAEINVKNKLTGTISDNSQLTLLGNPAKDLKEKDLAQIKKKQ
ncbi:DUF2807 domain-containing protein [Apibacter raozihei]|uniref:GIN domain-containing protein n=1 Tax=Apibacter TaxID=1778601 RepID=UPI000FE312D9|nr:MULTISPECIES: DUF2807 domain-containing protein [Apibacter]